MAKKRILHKSQIQFAPQALLHLLYFHGANMRIKNRKQKYLAC